jgi:hypothetical protein
MRARKAACPAFGNLYQKKAGACTNHHAGFLTKYLQTQKVALIVD